MQKYFLKISTTPIMCDSEVFTNYRGRHPEILE